MIAIIIIIAIVRRAVKSTNLKTMQYRRFHEYHKNNDHIIIIIIV